MARAKHTDRTEARRRHRAEQAALASAAGEEPTEDAAEDVPGARPAAAKPPAAPVPGRPGISAAFRGALRPLDLRGDLQALPRIVTHWAVLASSAIAIVASAVFVASTNELGAALDFAVENPLEGVQIDTVTNASYLAVSLFVAPPPAAGAFLLGFTAPRASWLGGLAFGIVAAVCYAVIVMSPAGRLLIGSNPPEAFVLQAAVVGPIGALLFASAAAWYKRFLNLASPNRGRRAANAKVKPKQRARPVTAKTGTRTR